MPDNDIKEIDKLKEEIKRLKLEKQSLKNQLKKLKSLKKQSLKNQLKKLKSPKTKPIIKKLKAISKLRETEPLSKHKGLLNISRNLIELSEKKLPVKEFVDEFLFPTSFTNHVPKLIALGMKIAKDIAELRKDYDEFLDIFDKKLKEEIERHKEYEKSYI